MGELDDELRELDREIAKYVLEAIANDKEGALRRQLEPALAAALKPLLAQNLADIASTLEKHLERVGASMNTATTVLADRIADTEARVVGDVHAGVGKILTGAAAHADMAHADMDGIAKTLGQLKRTLDAGPTVASSVAVSREPPQGVPALEPAPFPEAPAGIAAPHHVSGPHTTFQDREPVWDAFRRRWRDAAIATMGLVIAAAGVAGVTLHYRGYALQGPKGAQETAQQAPSTPSATEQDAAENGWRKVLSDVETWPSKDKEAALKLLCGEGGSAATCQSFADRWSAAPVDQQQRAIGYASRALGELGVCRGPRHVKPEGLNGGPGGQPDTRGGAAPTASIPASAAPTSPGDVLACLMVAASPP